MAGISSGDPSYHGMVEASPYRFSHDQIEENDQPGSSWYFSRKEIEENSPSRRDGIDLKKEAYFRKSYCTFLQDLGMRLKVPQVTIATAIVFCHRFFLRQSHAKNDRRTIATVCMFLAGKVEETPRPLKDVILVSYEIIHKKDPAAVQRIKQREVYEQQKELILLGERVVLATLGFDLNVHHPYKPLVEAIKKFKVAQNALAQVAWNFVNDGLRTSLCLQFKSHHIAAGAIFLAAKFLKVKLPSDGDKVWWQEFDVTPRQLEEVSNQMLELYEQNRAMAPSHGNETEGSSAGAATNHRVAPKAQPTVEEEVPSHNEPHDQSTITSSLQQGIHTSSTSRPVPEQLQTEKQNGTHKFLQSESNIDRSTEDPIEEAGGSGTTTQTREGPKGYSPLDAIKKIDKDKVKAALEKRRKERGEVAKKFDVMDDDDLIERELESGIELAVEDDKVKQETMHGWSKSSNRLDLHNQDSRELGIIEKENIENDEEGEFHSPEAAGRKRKIMSRDEYDYSYHHPPPPKLREVDDSRAIGRMERVERDHKRLRQENHV